MNKLQSWTVPKIIYTVLMSSLLLGYMIVIATYKDSTTTGQSYNLPIYFWVLRIITAISAIFLGKLWKDKGFLILITYLLLKAVRVAADNPAFLFNQGVSEILLTGFWVFSACYGLAKVLEKDQLKKFLSINTAIWTMGMVIYSCLGIYAAWTGKYIYNMGQGSYWGIKDQRLFLVYYVTTSGSVLSVSAVISCIGIFMAEHRLNKALFGVSMIPMLVAVSLTDSRNAQICIAIGISLSVGITLYRYCIKRNKKEKGWNVLLRIIVVSGVVFILVVIICTKTISVFNHYKKTGLLFTRAYAEVENDTEVLNRGFSGNDIFTGRFLIWKATLQKILSDSRYLIWGSSVINPMKDVTVPNMPWLNSSSHAHCMPLMVLLENGIVGFALLSAFFIMIIHRGLQIVLKKSLKMESLVLTLVISVAAGELVECFTWLRSGQAPTLPFFFLALGIIAAAGGQEEKQK